MSMMAVAVQVESLSVRDARRVYLITCSQANRDIVPTRKAFACIVLDAFENAVPKSIVQLSIGGNQVYRWCHCSTGHHNGSPYF